MKFQFHVNMNDQDYLDYNKFWILRSHYGKKQMTSLRLYIALIFGVCIFFTMYVDGFSLDSFIAAILSIILLIVFELFLSPLYGFVLKGYLKSLKKKGKMGYSPASDIAFYEDVLVETTPDNKTELKYSAVERISVVDDKVIYIHVNSIMSYILPLSCFETKEQYESFLGFIKTKCANIDIY